MSRKQFNFIYDKLVKDENDILGHIAYSIYKNQKREEIAKIKSKNGGADVTDEDLAPFVDLSQSNSQVGFYKDKATALAQLFLDEVVGQELEEAKRKQEADFIRNHKAHGFMYGVWQGVAASVIFVLAGFAFLMATGGWARIGKALIEIAK
ncbi:conserved hypothetical protein [Dethiosulfovibrio peptidovorans DSM 11002]|uniref:Uncharacterized protein n=1 Tax=Dethiosulfovibrio peptidovorans DSM 11002 TaxID=469381 RepID=D2Z3R6_9BACT|nr:hypothetical protein [Dethiosulfovibrio peptidovorans]EFC90372.1 conserved hypothetical protein [Dethiosulfovibrio peptidovorans DSM 11002]